MNVPDLRAAVTVNGGTPNRYDMVGLLRQLVTAYGGTPTKYSIRETLREAVTAAGGTPTQWSQVGLTRELVTALGVLPAQYAGRTLSAIVATTAKPAANLITNGTFDSGANWTLTQIGGTLLPTISGGKLNSNAGVEGNIQRAQQVLAGGSSPAGTYRVTLDSTIGSSVAVLLLGAADESRGTGGVVTGTAKTADIVASGEVSKIRLSMDNDGAIDNAMLTRIA